MPLFSHKELMEYKMNYFDQMQRTMTWLGEKDILFVGQTAAVPGTFMYPTHNFVPIEKKLEFPVNESLQTQFALGVALTGKKVISIYPRLNFMLLATGDIVNMIDKVLDISQQRMNPHIILRVAIGPDAPVHPGHQHVGDYSDAFASMCNNITVYKLDKAEKIFPIYKKAIENPGQYIIIEDGRLYNESKN